MRRKLAHLIASHTFWITLTAVVLGIHADSSCAQEPRWTEQQANAWYAAKPWPVGCNYAPRTAINQLEMWQPETFDLKTIDQELDWAESLGFNSIRVFLHDLPWADDRYGFLERIDQFLKVAEKHHIGVVFVVFDAVWDPNPKSGPQREPTPHVHNSGWVQSPGAAILGDPARHDELKGYVQGLIGHFRDDPRIYAWDLFNEPDNPNGSSYATVELKDKSEKAQALLEKTFAWARAVRPSQPLTSGVWLGDWSDPAKLSPMQKLQLEQSDILSFHCYGPLDDMKHRVEVLKRYNRPILCTEFMARPAGSTFKPILGYLKEQKVGAYCWGFVSGKTQTIYPWDSWRREYEDEPSIWFHDILHPDGSAFDPAEVHYIQSLTGKGNAPSPSPAP